MLVNRPLQIPRKPLIFALKYGIIIKYGKILKQKYKGKNGKN